MATFAVAVPNMKRLHQVTDKIKFTARKGDYNKTNRAIEIVDHNSAFYRCDGYEVECLDMEDCRRVDLPNDGVYVKTDTKPRYLSGWDFCGGHGGNRSGLKDIKGKETYIDDEWCVYKKNLMYEIVNLVTHKRYWLPQYSWVHFVSYVTVKSEYPEHFAVTP